MYVDIRELAERVIGRNELGADALGGSVPGTCPQWLVEAVRSELKQLSFGQLAHHTRWQQILVIRNAPENFSRWFDAVGLKRLLVHGREASTARAAEAALVAKVWELAQKRVLSAA